MSFCKFTLLIKHCVPIDFVDDRNCGLLGESMLLASTTVPAMNNTLE